MRRIAGNHHSNSVLLSDPYRVVATGVGNELPDSVIAVVDHARAIFRNDVPGLEKVDITRGDLFGVPDQQLNSM